MISHIMAHSSLIKFKITQEYQLLVCWPTFIFKRIRHHGILLIIYASKFCEFCFTQPFLSFFNVKCCNNFKFYTKYIRFTQALLACLGIIPCLKRIEWVLASNVDILLSFPGYSDWNVKHHIKLYFFHIKYTQDSARCSHWSQTVFRQEGDTDILQFTVLLFSFQLWIFKS